MLGLVVFCLLNVAFSAGEGEDPVGHMLPIGSHQPPLPVEVLEAFPDPLRFFDEYVRPSKPVVFKGAAKQFPSFENWKNDNYLSEKYGSWKVFVEEGKKENRSMGTQHMSYRKFLKTYNTSDIYLVQDVLPPNPMTKEVFLPKNLLCGGYTNYLSTAVMWFSSGGTRSVLHNDQYENINCLYDGSKQLVMIDQKLKDLVPIDAPEGGYSKVDVDHVDMHKYPTMRNISWHQAHMEEGDCLYIPSQWYHHVNSSDTRNLAINIWWVRMYDLPSRDECEKEIEKLPEFKPLHDYKMADPGEVSRSLLFSAFNDENRTATKEQFLEQLPKFMQEDGSADDKQMIEDELTMLFSTIDTDGDGILTAKEVYAVPLDHVTTIMGSGTEEEEFSDNEYPDEDGYRHRDEL